MPRDINGNYTLPAGNPVVSGTLIESVWCNTTMADIATALTNSLSRTGSGGMQAPMTFSDGSAGAPSISFTNAASSGWYRAGTDDFRFSIAGSDVLTLTPGVASLAGIWHIQESIGRFVLGTDTAGASGEKNSGCGMTGGQMNFGTLNDAADTYLQLIQMDVGAGTISAIAPAGFQVSAADLSVAPPFFKVDSANEEANLLGTMALAPESSDVTKYHSSTLSINVEDPTTYNALACSNTLGAGSVFGAAIFDWGGAIVGSITVTASAVAFNTTSDRRLKEDIRELSAVGDIIEQLNPVRFRWKNLKHDAVGFIAQEVIEVVPEAVIVPSSDEPWQMDASKLLPYIVAELKSLRARVRELESELGAQ